MNTALKFGIVTAVIGLIVFGIKKASDIGNGFKVDVLKYGLPKISNAVLTLPIQFRFNNPSPIAINLQQFIADIYLFKTTDFQKVGQINQSITIPPGQSVQEIVTQLSIKDLFSGNLLNFALSTISAQSIKLRTNITAVWHGIPIRPQPFLQEISLKNITNG